MRTVFPFYEARREARTDRMPMVTFAAALPPSEGTIPPEEASVDTTRSSRRSCQTISSRIGNGLTNITLRWKPGKPPEENSVGTTRSSRSSRQTISGRVSNGLANITHRWKPGKLRKRSTAEVLAGVHDNAKLSAAGRLYAAVLTSTVQHVPPTPKQMGHLSSDAEELSQGSARKSASWEEDEATSVKGKRFGLCYVTWRLENLRSGSIAMLVRAVFTGWIVVNAFQAFASPPVTCKAAICNATGACGSCLPNEDCLPKLDDVTMRTLREDGRCPSYMGVAPTPTFPLVPDHIRVALRGYDWMMLAMTTIRFGCELGAILCAWLAWCSWARYSRSNALVRVAFGLALMPPFVLAISFPLQLGLDEQLLLGRMCEDATALISKPGGGPNETRWALDLDLPPRSEFCKLPPKQWGPMFDQAMKDGGVIADYNASAKTRGLTCNKAEERRAECESGGFCKDCFRDFQNPNGPENIRNPCVDYATMSQLCFGRDDKYKKELAEACPDYTALQEAPTALNTKCDLTGTSHAGLATGGFSDPVSFCGPWNAPFRKQHRHQHLQPVRTVLQADAPDGLG